MRKLLPMFMLLVSGSAYGQFEEIPWDDNGDVIFTEVISVEGVDETTLYLRARKWFSKTYKKANEVLQMDEKEGGILVGKAINPIYVSTSQIAPTEVNMHYTIEVLLKDGRYKYKISDLRYETQGSRFNNYTPVVTYPFNVYSDDVLYKKNGNERKVNASYRDETLESINNLVASLKKAMDDSTPIVEVDKGDDW